ncbi:hypothetical protein BH23THE1_BH23THE1_30690 [soil metagenome]
MLVFYRLFASVTILILTFELSHAQENNYVLPVINNTELDSLIGEELSYDDFRIDFDAYPITITLSSVLTLAERKVLSLPILMEEEDLPIKTYPKLIDPNQWESKNYKQGVGRRSIWYMDKNNEMLYSILLDINSLNNKKGIGIGYLSVKRLSDTIYDWFLRGPNTELLYVVRGEKIILDELIGESTFYSLSDQSEIDKEYDYLWKGLPPINFVMFTK